MAKHLLDKDVRVTSVQSIIWPARCGGLTWTRRWKLSPGVIVTFRGGKSCAQLDLRAGDSVFACRRRFNHSASAITPNALIAPNQVTILSP